METRLTRVGLSLYREPIHIPLLLPCLRACSSPNSCRGRNPPMLNLERSSPLCVNVPRCVGRQTLILAFLVLNRSSTQAINFGIPGGLSAGGLMEYSQTAYNVEMSYQGSSYKCFDFLKCSSPHNRSGDVSQATD